jgi:iron(III) transport system ATP-binding protein
LDKALLESSGLSFKYPGEEKEAVANISFELASKEIITIVGSSGSGKSTLLNLIAGNLSPSEGRILINGEIMQDPAHFLVKGFDDVEIVKQDFQLSPRHTVSQIIKHPLRRYNQDFQDERVTELIQLCNLTGLEDKITMDLSGGQKQRVAIARSLADNPDLILMDEPFNQLDYTIKMTLKSELRSILASCNTGALIVTHDPLDALSISDRIIVLKQGKAVAIAEPAEHYLAPLNKYTAELFGQYNIIGQADLKALWSIDVDHDYCGCRPEQVMINDEGPLFHISDISYLGRNYMVSAYHRETTLFFYSDHELAIGGEIRLGIQEDLLHPILVE